MQFCPGMFHVPTSGRPPGHPIPNALTSHHTLHLLMAGLGHEGQHSAQLEAWIIRSVSWLSVALFLYLHLQ